MGFVLPPRSQVGYLDPEIAGEGSKIILSDGEQVNWSPPPPKPVMPDWSGIKSIQKYFNRSGYVVWPAWLYHPTQEPRLVKNAHEAAELGICYREASFDEKGRYGRDHVWDWKDDCEWRPQPFGKAVFDPKNPGHGKTYVPSAPNPIVAQNQLLEALIPTVTAAVVTALKGGAGPAAPAHIDPAQWEEFLAFQAFKKTTQAVDALDEKSPALNFGHGEDDRAMWEEAAKRKGIKVDGRWSLERLRAEVEKAA